MENVIIFHGTDCTPQSFWYSWLKERLEERGDVVSIPHYPELNHELVGKTAERVLGEFTLDSETRLIGHRRADR